MDSIVFKIDMREFVVKKWKGANTVAYNELHNYITDNFLVYDVSGKYFLIPKKEDLIDAIEKSIVEKDKDAQVIHIIPLYYGIYDIFFPNGVNFFLDKEALEPLYDENVDLYATHWKKLDVLISKSVA